VAVVIEIAVESEAWRQMGGAERTVRQAIEAAVSDAGRTTAEVGVVLTDDARIRDLNRTWLGNDNATNVLSFPAPDASPAGDTKFLGDLVLALQTIRREAEDEQKSFERHLAHLAVHGSLHLLGFDHASDQDAEVMEERERRILARLGIPDPYASSGAPRTEPA
jgi:probable rRNA maturation factor